MESKVSFTPVDTAVSPTANAVKIGGSGLGRTAADSTHDTLGFSAYVKAVVSFLTHRSTAAPFTLSIEGEWGSGKSSFMLQLADSLRDARQKTVSFNAWRFDKQESMWAAFALQFTDKLINDLRWYMRPVAHIRIQAARFEW